MLRICKKIKFFVKKSSRKSCFGKGSFRKSRFCKDFSRKSCFVEDLLTKSCFRAGMRRQRSTYPGGSGHCIYAANQEGGHAQALVDLSRRQRALHIRSKSSFGKDSLRESSIGKDP